MCPVLYLTGLPCPFCGMTRATFALARGDLDAALAAHPLSPLVLAGVIALVALIATGRTQVVTRGVRPWLLVGAVAALWIAKLST